MSEKFKFMVGQRVRIAVAPERDGQTNWPYGAVFPMSLMKNSLGTISSRHYGNGKPSYCVDTKTPHRTALQWPESSLSAK